MSCGEVMLVAKVVVLSFVVLKYNSQRQKRCKLCFVAAAVEVKTPPVGAMNCASISNVCILTILVFVIL